MEKVELIPVNVHHYHILHFNLVKTQLLSKYNSTSTFTSSAMFSLATKVLSAVASPVIQKAYEKGCSIWEARDELDKLRRSIQTIQVVLIDAEKKEESFAAVKDWIKRVRDVLYDADDLFDEVATDDMLKKQTVKEGKLLKKERVSCFKLNPVVSRNSIANRFKDIRKRFLEISTDMAQFQFVICQREEPISSARRGQDPGSFVDSKDVIGRDKDKEAILEMLLHDDPLVIAIVGIGGMGKTTLAQLVYNDTEVQQRFESKWFACISDISDEKEVLWKIFQSISGEKDNNFTVSQLQNGIRDAVNGKRFMLVLDDVWDNDRARWIGRMRLLRGGAKGSKIIVTTRSLLVARVVDALEPHNLKGLSEDESWDLFKRVAFTREQEEKDPRWTDLGREIVKKCANVPLAIKSIGRLLYTKTTIQEWETFKNVELAKLGESGPDNVMSVLKISYDHLHSSMKRCFAYCSLFPKDYRFDKHDLIDLWIAQGYIEPNNEEQTVEWVGHSYFMDLFRMSFFQEAEYDYHGEIAWCKMHDLIHDLAQQVAAEESVTLTSRSTNITDGTRHASVVVDESGSLAPLLMGNRLRSLLFIDTDSCCGLDLDQEFTKLKFLRTLKLSKSGIENVPSCIGELKHLRYLDMSKNTFKRLPDSVTKLLNLCTLKVYHCPNLEALPDDLRKLINLRKLKIKDCGQLQHMPAGLGELDSLQHLDEFKVGGGLDRGQWSKLGVLFGLNLKGKLRITFEDEAMEYEAMEYDWDGVEGWKPLINLQELCVENYKGKRIPLWANGGAGNPSQPLLPNLTSLSLFRCNRVKSLPPLWRHLPNLKHLVLFLMWELEYIEEEEEREKNENTQVAAASDASFLPYLETLRLWGLRKLKGWSRKVEAAMTSKDNVAPNGEEHSSSTRASALTTPLPRLLSFPRLSTLEIYVCEELKYMPKCPNLGAMTLVGVDAQLVSQLLSIRDNQDSCPSTTTSSPSSLERVEIRYVDGLTSFPGRSLTSLRQLRIHRCDELKDVELAPSHLNILEKLSLVGHCRELNMWEESGKRGVDWDSLPNLRDLSVPDIPSPDRLPDCLRNLQSLGKLQIHGIHP